MKAIVNVHEKSSYSRYNGLTFPVKEVLSNMVALDIKGITVDFTHKEVMIVDFSKELQIAYNQANWDSKYMAALHNLRAYKISNNIQNAEEIYNCPA